jgi:hypothetical protein
MLGPDPSSKDAKGMKAVAAFDWHPLKLAQRKQ